MSKAFLFDIAICGVSFATGYWIAKMDRKKKKEEVKVEETPIVEESVEEVYDEKPESRISVIKRSIRRAVRKIVTKVKLMYHKSLIWLIENAPILQTLGVVISLGTSILEFRSAMKPVAPIELTKQQVEDVIRTTFDSYLDIRSDMMTADTKRQGVQEFLDDVVRSKVRVMNNSLTGDQVECRLITKGAAA